MCLALYKESYYATISEMRCTHKHTNTHAHTVHTVQKQSTPPTWHTCFSTITHTENGVMDVKTNRECVYAVRLIVAQNEQTN